MQTLTLGRRVVTGVGDDGRSTIASDGSTGALIVLEQLANSSYEALWEAPLPIEDAATGTEPEGVFPYIPPA